MLRVVMKVNYPRSQSGGRVRNIRAWPCQVEGIGATTDGTSPQPKLTVANLDSSITALCLAYDDLLQAKVSIHDTLARYLDARNYPEGNPLSGSDAGKLKVFYIDAKSTETNEQVEFTLSQPYGFAGTHDPHPATSFALHLVYS